MRHEGSIDIPLEVVEIIMSYLQDQEELASLRSALLVNKTFFHAAVKILYKDPFALFAVPYNIPTVVWKHRLLLFETMCKNVKPHVDPPRPYSTYIDYISLGATLDHSDIHYSALYAARYVSDLAYKYSNHWAVEMTKRICQAYMDRAPKLNSIRVGFCPAPPILDLLRHSNMAHVELLNQGGQKRPNGLSPQELFEEISRMPNLKSLYAYGGLPRETFYPILERKGGLEQIVLQIGPRSPPDIAIIANNHSDSLKRLHLLRVEASDANLLPLVKCHKLEQLRLPRLHFSDECATARLRTVLSGCPNLHTLDLTNTAIPLKDLAVLLQTMGPRMIDLRLSPRRDADNGDPEVSRFMCALSTCCNIRRLELDSTSIDRGGQGDGASAVQTGGLIGIMQVQSLIYIVNSMKSSIRYFQAKSLFAPDVMPEVAAPGLTAIAKIWSKTLNDLYLENCPVDDNFVKQLVQGGDQDPFASPLQHLSLPLCKFLTDETVHWLVKGAVGVELPQPNLKEKTSEAIDTNTPMDGPAKWNNAPLFDQDDVFAANKFPIPSWTMGRQEIPRATFPGGPWPTIRTQEFLDARKSTPVQAPLSSGWQFGLEEIPRSDPSTSMPELKDTSHDLIAPTCRPHLKYLRLAFLYMCTGISDEKLHLAHKYLGSIGVVLADVDSHSQGRKPARLASLKLNDYLDEQDWEALRAPLRGRWKRRRADDTETVQP